MQNYSQTEQRRPVVFDTKLEDIPGGVTVAVKNLTQKKVKAGTPIGKDVNGLYHVVKVAKLHANAANDATTYQVKKGHNFKVGDFITIKPGAKAYAITAIDTSNADYDVLTVGTTLGVALTASNNVYLVEAVAQAATDSSVLKFEPVGLVGTTFDVTEDDNHLVDCVVRGSVREGVIDPISPELKSKLPLIRFV